MQIRIVRVGTPPDYITVRVSEGDLHHQSCIFVGRENVMRIAADLRRMAYALAAKKVSETIDRDLAFVLAADSEFRVTTKDNEHE